MAICAIGVSSAHPIECNPSGGPPAHGTDTLQVRSDVVLRGHVGSISWHSTLCSHLGSNGASQVRQPEEIWWFVCKDEPLADACSRSSISCLRTCVSYASFAMASVHLTNPRQSTGMLSSKTPSSMTVLTYVSSTLRLLRIARSRRLAFSTWPQSMSLCTASCSKSSTAATLTVHSASFT